MCRAFILLFSLACAAPASAETVRSLDRIEPSLKTPEAREFFSQQMKGTPAPDLLGVKLPSGLTAEAIANLLVPPSDKAKRNLIGARPWPARPDHYVAIVCTGGAEPYSPNEPRCARPIGEEKEPRLKVYLGVLALNGNAPRLVAASGPVDCATDWRKSGLPRMPMAAEDMKNGTIQPAGYDRFDLAPYRIAPEQTAFGVRGSWMESYAGGGANFTGLCLFAIDGNRLKQILAVPMSAYSDVAGDWHKDGTRSHDITEAANILIVSKQSTAGYFDLLVKGRSGKFQRLFKWSKPDGVYR